MNSNDQVIECWEGDSLEMIRSFPLAIRIDIGAELRRMQMGELPLISRPMKSIGARVYELKQQDADAWYRLIYLAKVKNIIYVLHCFKNKSAKTSKKDIFIAKKRLKNVNLRIRLGKTYE
jgi:phage-related protein